MSSTSLWPSPLRMRMGTALGETITRPGQLRRSKSLHTYILSSLITGCFTSYLNTASLTLALPFSLVNLALWQPMKAMQFSFANLFSRYSRSGNTCRQLMQQYVQKSIRTSLFFSSLAKDNGCELNQVLPLGKSLTFSYTIKTYMKYSFKIFWNVRFHVC